MGSLTFLGTGTSTGVPAIGCQCEVCVSNDPKNKRLRASVWIEQDGLSVLIDTSTDLRAQALRAGITNIDAVLYTHHHADHVHGIDELRSFSFFHKKQIPCYANQESIKRLKEMFGYIFNGDAAVGGGKPDLSLNYVDGPFAIGAVKVTPIAVKHGSMDVFGYRINDTAYVTDCSFIPPSSEPLLEGLDTLILGALGFKTHATHFTLEKALDAIELLKPGAAYLTHLTHNMMHEEVSARLPERVNLAWDGLMIDI